MKKYILFGAGACGRELFHRMGADRIAYVCDNRKKVKWEGVSSVDFSRLREIHADYKVVITPKDLRIITEIAIQLAQASIPYYFPSDLVEELLTEDIEAYQKMNRRESFAYDEAKKWLLWSDKFGDAGSAKNNSYFWQDLWAAQKINDRKPTVHMDIGSRIDGFISSLLSFGQQVCLLDIRPLDVDIPGLEFVQCNAMTLDAIKDDSLVSVSALCSLEHFGLGRYGDPIDPEACFICFDAIERKSTSGGIIYLSVPVGKEHVEFNAHRIFAPTTIINAFPKCDLLEFSITDGNGIRHNVSPEEYGKGGDSAGIFGLFMLQKN